MDLNRLAQSFVSPRFVTHWQTRKRGIPGPALRPGQSMIEVTIIVGRFPRRHIRLRMMRYSAN